VPKQRQLTREQVEAKKDKASQFVRDVVGDDDSADDFDDMSIEDYADHKHIQITNPKGGTSMANGNSDPRTKADLLEEMALERSRGSRACLAVPCELLKRSATAEGRNSRPVRRRLPQANALASD
jgi:hypothetical protein